MTPESRPGSPQGLGFPAPSAPDGEPMAGEQAAAGSRWRSAASRSMGGSMIASGVSQLALIVSGVLVARSLGPPDRGYLALLVVVSGICFLIGSIGIPSAVTYYIARDRSHAREIASSLLGPAVLQVGATLALQIAVLVALVIHDPERVKVAALISLLLVPGHLALWYGLAILQGQQRFAAFNVLRTLPTAVYVAGVGVVFLLHSDNLVSLMTIWATANVVGGFFAVGVAVRGLPRAPASSPPPSRSQMTKFGLKSLVGTVSPIEALRLDQAVVGLFMNPTALGLYVVAQAFTNLPRLVAASIGLVAYPQVASQPDPAAARRDMWRYFLLSVALSALVVGALEIATGELVTLFFGSEFSGATPIARILLLGALFMAARRVLADGLNGMGYPGLGTLSEVASWILLIPTFAILLPRLGAEGVALALAISWGASLLLLLALAGMAGTRLSSAVRAPRDLTTRFGNRLGLVTGNQLVALTVTVAASTAAGIAVAVLPPRTALVAILALSAALFFAFGRTALGQKTHSARVALVKARSWRDDAQEVWSRQPDTEFRLPRLLYYVGLVLLGLLTLRAGGQVTFSDVLFLFSFLLACAELVIVRRQVPIRLPFLLFLGMAIFSLGGLLSTFESYEYVKSTGVIVRLIFLTVFWFWLGTIVLNTRERVRKATTLWVASAAIGGAAAVLQFGVGDVIPGGAVAGGRMTGFAAHPNELGGLTCIAFIPALMLAARQRIPAPQRLFSYALLLLVAAGLILSGSVGALLASAAATFMWFAFQRSSVHAILVLATIGLCVIAVTTVQGVRGAPTPLERLERVTQSSGTAGGGTGSVDQRIATYRVVWREIEEDPFVGVGLDIVSVTKPFGIVSDEYDPHNIIIGLWYKTGLVGLAGMLIAFFAVFRSGWNAILQSRSETERNVAVALVCAVVAFVAFAMSEPVLFSRYGWISAALLLALRAVQQRDSRVARASSYEEDLHESALAPART
jgi:O-antigen/teichoic acid export membrane protein/O-antigen ligase